MVFSGKPHLTFDTGHTMKLIMLGVIVCMIGGVLSLAVLGGSGSKQIAKGGTLLTSISPMGPR
jgi:hypothetical protein